MKRLLLLRIALLGLLASLASVATAAEPLKVFVLAGDEYVLEHG